MKKLFIVGSGRSGTTMLQQALNRHSRIVIPPETGYFIEFLGQTRRMQRYHLRRINADLGIDLPAPSHRIPLSSEAVRLYDRLAQSYLAKLGRKNVAYFGEKSPRHLLVLPRIVKLLPDARFILIYRDGRDVALSMKQVPWAPNDLYLNFSIWLEYDRWQSWAERRPALHLLSIRYEDFVVEPEAHLRRIASFLDLDYEPAMTTGSGNREGVPEREYAWKGGALDRINTSRVERWREALSRRELAILERWGRTALERRGYALETGGHIPLPMLFHTRVRIKRMMWQVRCLWAYVGRELEGLRR